MKEPKGRVSYPEPATARYNGTPYETWCRQRRMPKVLVRTRGQSKATIIWDCLPIEGLIRDGWPDAADRADIELAISDVVHQEYAIVGGLFFGYVDLTDCTFSQVAATAERIAAVLDGRFGVQHAAA